MQMEEYKIMEEEQNGIDCSLQEQYNISGSSACGKGKGIEKIKASKMEPDIVIEDKPSQIGMIYILY